MPPRGRILAVDWGTRRIGLALSDETQTLAQPLTTLTRRAGKRFPMPQLLEQITKHEVVGIIVGLPLDAAGTEGAVAHSARALDDGCDRRVGELEVRMVGARVNDCLVLAEGFEHCGST